MPSLRRRRAAVLPAGPAAPPAVTLSAPSGQATPPAPVDSADDGPRRVRRGLRHGRLATVLVVGGTALGAGLLFSALVSAVAAYFVRRVLTPDRVRPDDTEVLSVGPGTVTLRATDETVARGRYGLRLHGGLSHARLGEVLRADGPTVTRELVEVDGPMKVGPARWSPSYYAGDPTSALGLPHEDVVLDGEVGPLPAWVVPPPEGAPASDVWAVLVHGRGATREECLRALPVLQRLGLPAVVPSYRNDADAPALPGGRYHLGDTEWADIEHAVRLALRRGASGVVLVGWSMGGAIVLQLLSRSRLLHVVRAVVLDAPVVSWADVLDHQARVNRVPVWVARLGVELLGRKQADRLFGVEGPVELDRFDWVARANELRHRMLVVHSDDDEFVPSGPTRRLAQARPDLVTHVPFRGARHCQEWNVDPVRWEQVVEDYLRAELGSQLPAAAGDGPTPS
ncbi:alpha/beta hydrolase family protein [Aquipuribacter hungaricus]|uniref:Alpha/beta hydrolase family protein n=1 Tax=Aquipuribacter hungaricus TaxID=545624 RepID=A0ABV7WC75_9MICO